MKTLHLKAKDKKCSHRKCCQDTDQTNKKQDIIIHNKGLCLRNRQLRFQ
ncbi:MAG: hypothetical protein P1U34_07505 [Coxiellaceae bacterium]|nr:hypothetical protein [Coxiellaceae bacterium]